MNFTCNDIFYCTPALSTDIDIPVLSTMFGVFGAVSQAYPAQVGTMLTIHLASLRCTAHPSDHSQSPQAECRRRARNRLPYVSPDSAGLDVPMMLSWAVAGLTLAVYGIMRDLQIALQIQAHLLVAFSLISWVQCMAYRTVRRKLLL